MRIVPPTLLIVATLSLVLGARTCAIAQSKRSLVRQLQTSTFLSLEGVTLRECLRALEAGQGISCVLDRRVDPEQAVSLDINGISLGRGLSQLAESRGLGVSVLPNAIYIGPREAARKLRTLVEIRADDLKSRLSRIPAPRQQQLKDSNYLGWPMLAEPRRIVAELARKFQFEFVDGGLLPHDLWAEVKLERTTFVEVLSLVLIQYDRTFAINAEANRIEVVPIPSDVRIQRTLTLKAGESISTWSLAAHTAEIEIGGRRVSVLGYVEDFEAINSVRDGTWKPTAGPVEVVPLAQRRFPKLRVSQVPLKDLMEELEKSGIRFEYQVRSFERAGIDLKQAIPEIDIADATPDDLFHAMFSPLGIGFRYQGVTVELFPVKPSE